MTKNRLDIQTISTKRTDFQTDLVYLFGQLTEKNEIVDPSQNQKSAIYANTHEDNKISFINKLLKRNVQYIAPFDLRIISLTH